MKQFECKDHPQTFFGNNISELLNEDDGWGNCINNGCIHTDLIIQQWKDTFEPIDTIKEEKGAYSILKKFVSENTVSGTFYRSTDYFENDELDVGMKINYSHMLSSWSEDIKESWKYNRTILFKFETSNIKGINISDRDENTFILGEMILEIICKENYEDGFLITMKIV